MQARRLLDLMTHPSASVENLTCHWKTSRICDFLLSFADLQTVGVFAHIRRPHCLIRTAQLSTCQVLVSERRTQDGSCYTCCWADSVVFVTGREQCAEQQAAVASWDRPCGTRLNHRWGSWWCNQNCTTTTGVTFQSKVGLLTIRRFFGVNEYLVLPNKTQSQLPPPRRLRLCQRLSVC